MKDDALREYIWKYLDYVPNTGKFIWCGEPATHTKIGKTEGWIPTGSAQKSGRFELFKTLIVYHVSILAAILGALIGYRLAYKDFINFVPLIGLFIYYVATLRSVLMLK